MRSLHPARWCWHPAGAWVSYIGDLDFVVGRIQIDHAAVGTHLQTFERIALEHAVPGQLAEHRLDGLERAEGFAAAHAGIRLHLVDDHRLLALRRHQ